MNRCDIAVLIGHDSNELLPALETALTMRDEQQQQTASDNSTQPPCPTVWLIAMGNTSQAVDYAREGLFRGADNAVVLSDPLFEGRDEGALVGIVGKLLEDSFATVITSGQSGECRPRNAHLVLRYKRAKTANERTPEEPYDYLYDQRPHLIIPVWDAAKVGLTVDNLPEELLHSGESLRTKWGKRSEPTVILHDPNSTQWIDEVAQMLLDNRPARLSRRLRDAQIVVGGGYGVGSAEGFESLGEFAAEIKARMGATRAAVDAEFCAAKLMIGPTGERIHPKIYIACGISGQVQHIAGIAEGTTIISINTDPEAPIVEIADWVIVGSIEDVVPLLMERYKELRSKQNTK